MWYSAHLIVYLEYTEEKQEEYFAYENIVLIESENKQDAFAKAEKFGKQYEGNTGIGAENKPAKWVFGGVRLLVECQDIDPESLIQPPDFKPTHGTEVTYIGLRVTGKENLVKLIRGDEVEVTRE